MAVEVWRRSRADASAQSEMESPTEVAMEAEIRRSQWLVNPLAARNGRVAFLSRRTALTHDSRHR